jgi:hypothetical protein
MNRNRDLDGNGDIDPKEVKWYCPTSSQYIQIALAQGELPDPIMRFTDYSPTYLSSKATDYVDATYNFHYITSDYQYYWAEELVNTGNTPFGGYNAGASVAFTVRCIRNLGTDPSVPPVMGVAEVGKAFTHDPDARTFTQDKFNDESLRGYTIGGIAPHDAASVSSRPYKKFEYAEHLCNALQDDYVKFNSNISFLVTNNNDHDRIAAWTKSLEINGICSQYTQENDLSDLGTWRVPTACEMALMWIEGVLQNTRSMESGYLDIPTDQAYFLSSTYNYFVAESLKSYTSDNHKFLGYNDNSDRKVPSIDCLDSDKYSKIRLRCVRDVKM